MLSKTECIILHKFKYSESSLIVHGYTREHGRVSFILQGIRKKNSQTKANLFQPLFLLDLDIYVKSKRQLQRIKEAKNSYPFQSVPYDYIKRSVALFLAEFLYKTLKEEEPNPELFDFISTHVKLLDLKDGNIPNFHIYFLLQLSKYLGFFPDENIHNQPFFDLEKGVFTSEKPVHKHFLRKPYTGFWGTFLKYSSNQHENVRLSRSERQTILESIIKFYQLHFHAPLEIKSYEILKETLGD
jgi:DNA repair protein RecO (recombination protein O)